jgi:hypothetical protein
MSYGFKVAGKEVLQLENIRVRSKQKATSCRIEAVGCGVAGVKPK